MTGLCSHEMKVFSLTHIEKTGSCSSIALSHGLELHLNWGLKMFSFHLLGLVTDEIDMMD